MPAADLLAAVSAAIDVAPEPKEKVVAADPLDEEIVETPAGDDAEEEEVVDEEEIDEEEAEAEEGDEPELGADGKPVVAAKVKTPAEIAAEATAAAALKPKDFLNDPIDPRLKEGTQERIRGLIGIAKDLTTKHDEVKQNLDAVMAPILESRANDAQFTQAMQYIGAVNSGDPTIMEKAWNFMMGEMQALGRMLGKEVPGMDYLAAHPDLKQAVTAGQMTQEAAKELAIHRDTAAHRVQQSHQQRQQQQTQDQRNALITEGSNALNALGVQLKGSDPLYERKRAILTAALKGTFAQIDPRQWAPAYKRAYDALVLPAAPAVATPKVKSNLPANQPLRGKQPAGGTVAAPKSAREAIENALSGM